MMRYDTNKPEFVASFGEFTVRPKLIFLQTVIIANFHLVTNYIHLNTAEHAQDVSSDTGRIVPLCHMRHIHFLR